MENFSSGNFFFYSIKYSHLQAKVFTAESAIFYRFFLHIGPIGFFYLSRDYALRNFLFVDNIDTKIAR